VIKNAKPKWGYLIGITFLAGFCTQSLGEGLAANSAAYASEFTTPVYLTNKSRNETLLSAGSVIAVALGALFGGKLINSYGRKKTIIWSNNAIILLSVLSCIPIFELVLALRFLFGVTVGFLLAAAPKIVLETVPADLLGSGFGSFANIFTFFFVVIVVTINLLNSELMNTHGFYIIYLIPIPFTLIANLGLYRFYEYDTPTHIVENYPCPDCITTRCQDCHDHIKVGLRKQVDLNEE